MVHHPQTKMVECALQALYTMSLNTSRTPTTDNSTYETLNCALCKPPDLDGFTFWSEVELRFEGGGGKANSTVCGCGCGGTGHTGGGYKNASGSDGGGGQSKTGDGTGRFSAGTICVGEGRNGLRSEVVNGLPAASSTGEVGAVNSGVG